jgi:hypothetical protein
MIAKKKVEDSVRKRYNPIYSPWIVDHTLPNPASQTYKPKYTATAKVQSTAILHLTVS